MSVHWIKINSRLQESVLLINGLSRSKFNSLLKHIVQAETDEIFTEAELVKLSETLKLDSAKVQLLIQSIAHIFKQSSKIILKPTILQEQLTEKLKFDEDKAEDFVKLWTQETKKNFDVENSKNLDKISWELNIQTASNINNKDYHVNTRLQMGLVSVDGQETENITLELNKDELESLYTTLENIQSKLDSISM